jgi:hypothetical protein
MLNFPTPEGARKRQEPSYAQTFVLLKDAQSDGFRRHQNAPGPPPAHPF